MTQIFNQTKLKKLRKILRNKATSSENVLWQKLRKRQVGGLRFRRQVSIGKYTVDFYCPEINLVIEVDGNTHFISHQIEEKDLLRQKTIENLGIKFLRFTSTDVYNNMNNVLNEIYLECNSPPPDPPFVRGRKRSNKSPS